MTTTEIRELLDRDPFKPFRVQLSSGKHYDIRDPLAVAVMRNQLFVTLPDGERWVFVPYLHIAAVEALKNGTGPRRRTLEIHDGFPESTRWTHAAGAMFLSVS